MGQLSEAELESCEISTKRKMFLASNLISIAAVWKSVVIDRAEVKLQIKKKCHTTVIRSSILNNLGCPILDGTAGTLEAYDEQNLYFKENDFCDLSWNDRVSSKLPLEVVQSNKSFRTLWTRDLSTT